MKSTPVIMRTHPKTLASQPVLTVRLGDSASTDLRRDRMSTVEQQPAAAQNGAGAPTIAVENPATGETIAHVPDLTAEQVADLARRARIAQPGWEALGFEGRAEVFRELRRWFVQNRDRVVQTIMEETGKTREDAQTTELFLILDGLQFWAKKAPKFLADERIKSNSPFT